MTQNAPEKYYREGISLIDLFKMFPNELVAESGLRNGAGEMKEHVRIAALRAQKFGRAASLCRIAAKIVESISAFAVARLWRSQKYPCKNGRLPYSYTQQV